MPWREASTVSEREEFVRLAMAASVNMRELCRRFGISAKTGYKWLGRFEEGGEADLTDRSRRPHCSPGRTQASIEQMVLKVRQEHPAWGGRKIRAVLARRGEPQMPSPSTITEILRRHGKIDPVDSVQRQRLQRFEAAAPNALWQMDFKGHFAMRDGRCHPLTVLDDHSRYAVGLRACGDEQTGTVQQQLTRLFERYGLPDRMLADNGPPWGGMGLCDYTPLGAWLIRLGISLIHGRPYHPQTQGKDERFHRTLKAEVLQHRELKDLGHCQREFDAWRDTYNYERPHESLEMATPASRYRPSPRGLPRCLPPVEYGPQDIVRKVASGGEISYEGRELHISKGLRGQHVALRPRATDGELDVYFCHQHLGVLEFVDREHARLVRPEKSHSSDKNSQDFTKKK